MAPPALSAVLSLKTLLITILLTSPLKYIAPPLSALLLMNVELILEFEQVLSK